jgi:hypothetical protein
VKQLTVRGFDAELARELERLAKEEGISLNQAALRLLNRGAGLDRPAPRENLVGDSLDHLIGTWSAEEAAAVERAVADFEDVDEAMWR